MNKANFIDEGIKSASNHDLENLFEGAAAETCATPALGPAAIGALRASSASCLKAAGFGGAVGATGGIVSYNIDCLG